MKRTVTAVLLALLVGAAATAYINRDAIVDDAIRDRLARGHDALFAKDKEKIRVLICGTGSPEVSTAQAQACTLVAAGGKMFLFDAGDGAVRALARANIPVGDIERAFITFESNTQRRRDRFTR